jgi:SsrA-binding protein
MSNVLIATNREARYYYSIIDTYEAGIELKGSEVKSLREHKATLKDGFARVEKEEVFLYNTHISPYDKAGRSNPDSKRVRKLLLHKSQINKLIGACSQKGFTLIPLKLYFKGGLVKVEIAVCKGKRLFDRREEIKKETIEREINRELKEKGGERYRLR